MRSSQTTRLRAKRISRSCRTAVRAGGGVWGAANGALSGAVDEIASRPRTPTELLYEHGLSFGAAVLGLALLLATGRHLLAVGARPTTQGSVTVTQRVAQLDGTVSSAPTSPKTTFVAPRIASVATLSVEKIATITATRRPTGGYPAPVERPRNIIERRRHIAEISPHGAGTLPHTNGRLAAKTIGVARSGAHLAVHPDQHLAEHSVARVALLTATKGDQQAASDASLPRPAPMMGAWNAGTIRTGVAPAANATTSEGRHVMSVVAPAATTSKWRPVGALVVAAAVPVIRTMPDVHWRIPIARPPKVNPRPKRLLGAGNPTRVAATIPITRTMPDVHWRIPVATATKTRHHAKARRHVAGNSKKRPTKYDPQPALAKISASAAAVTLAPAVLPTPSMARRR